MSEQRTIGIIVFDGVLTSEVIGPAEVFARASEEDWFAGRVLLIGVEERPIVRTHEGIRLAVDATIAGAPALDVLLVPGANDIRPLLGHEALNAFIRQQETNAQWLGSLCAGAFVLGQAGVLDGKRATTWFGGEARLQSSYPAIEVVHDAPVVVDNRRITANGGLVSYQAALVLLGQLAGPERAREIYEGLGMDRLDDWTTIEATIVEAQSWGGKQAG